MRKPPNRQAFAAPLAGAWSVEDAEKRQLPGTLRVADPYSAASLSHQKRLKVAGCRAASRPKRFAG